MCVLAERYFETFCFQDDDDDGSYETIEVDEEEERALSVFMSQDPPTRRTLADVVMESIKDKRTELSTVLSGEWEGRGEGEGRGGGVASVPY